MRLLPYYLRQIRYGRTKGTSWSQLRYYPRWKHALQAGSSAVEDRLPWLTFPAIDRLDRWAQKEYRVFEYGGGGSTLFWAERVGEVVTVEHDAEWYALLEARMKDMPGAQWTGLMVPATPSPSAAMADPADPRRFDSSDAAYAGMHFKEYVEAIARYPDAYFDAVVVDGRARTACIHNAVSKVRPGGLLVLDNAERPHYTRNNGEALQGFAVALGGMAPAIYNRDFSETRIYRKG